MTIYMVIEQGVYRHATLGVFLTLEVARSQALEWLRDPKHDGYHSAVIRKCEVGALVGDSEFVVEFRKPRKRVNNKWEFGEIIEVNEDPIN